MLGTAGLRAGRRRSPTCSTTFRTIADIPRDSLGAYVITMAGRAVGRARRRAAAARGRHRAAAARRPAVRDGARPARRGGVIDALLSIPWYRDRVMRDEGRQEVMVGYSDSAKDVGRLAAALGALQGAGGDRRGVPRSTACRSRSSTAAAAASAAAAARRIWRSSRSRRDRSTARCASPSRAR